MMGWPGEEFHILILRQPQPARVFSLTTPLSPQIEADAHI